MWKIILFLYVIAILFGSSCEHPGTMPNQSVLVEKGQPDGVTLLTGELKVPATQTPIAINIRLLSQYPSLAVAVATIGKTRSTLIIDRDASVSIPLKVPETLKFKIENGSTITKSDIGTITFQGEGLANPDLIDKVFVGFGIGDVVWSGTKFPREISTEIFDGDNDITAKISRACKAIENRFATVKVYPIGAITGRSTCYSNTTIEFQEGLFENNANISGQIVLDGDNITVRGKGWNTQIKESSVKYMSTLIIAQHMTMGNLDGTAENLNVSDFKFVGQSILDGFVDGASSAIQLGNVKKSVIKNIWFSYSHAYGAYVGGFSTAGHYAEDVTIEDCIFEGLQSQNTGAINGKNITIRNNRFLKYGLPAYIAVIDFEPNVDTDRLDGIIVENNYFDSRAAKQFHSALVVQRANARIARNIVVKDNVVIGQNADLSESTGLLTVGINVEGFQDGEISGNYVQGAQTAMQIQSSVRLKITNNRTSMGGGQGNVWLLQNVTDSLIFGNIHNRAGTGLQHARLEEREAYPVPVNVSGTSVRFIPVNYWFEWWLGRKLVINGEEVTLVSLSPDRFIATISRNLGTLTNVSMTTKFGGNKYKENDFSEGIVIPLGSTSVNLGNFDNAISSSIGGTY